MYYDIIAVLNGLDENGQAKCVDVQITDTAGQRDGDFNLKSYCCDGL